MNIGESGLASPERRLQHDEAGRVARHAVFADFTGIANASRDRPAKAN